MESEQENPGGENAAAAEDTVVAGAGRLGPDPAATSRAFVVQLTSDAASPDAFCGRVRHLATSDGGNFSSPDALVAIIRRVLRRMQPVDSAGDE